MKELEKLITSIYNSQRARSKERNHEMPNYTLKELGMWLRTHKNFPLLYNNYVASGFKKMLVPSVDRKNDNIGYRFDNIQLMTYREHLDLTRQRIITGIDLRTSKAVLQYTLDGVFIKEFHSQKQASRETGINASHISECCKGKHKQARGFVWKYKITKITLA